MTRVHKGQPSLYAAPTMCSPAHLNPRNLPQWLHDPLLRDPAGLEVAQQDQVGQCIRLWGMLLDGSGHLGSRLGQSAPPSKELPLQGALA